MAEVELTYVFPQISERLGHTDIKTTMNTYGHYLEEADQKAADIMDNLFSNLNKPQKNPISSVSQNK